VTQITGVMGLAQSEKKLKKGGKHPVQCGIVRENFQLAGIHERKIKGTIRAETCQRGW
jgi:hypothetical protein